MHMKTKKVIRVFKFEVSFDLDEGPKQLPTNQFEYNKKQFIKALKESLPIKVVYGVSVLGKAKEIYIEPDITQGGLIKGSKLIFVVDGPDDVRLRCMEKRNVELAPAWIKGTPPENEIREITELYPMPYNPAARRLDVAINEKKCSKETLENALKEIKLKKLQGIDLVDAINLLSDMGERVVDDLESERVRITRSNVAFMIQKAADEVIEKLGVEVELPFAPDDLDEE